MINMISMYDLTITLSKTNNMSQYPVLSILMEQQLNEYFEKTLKASLSNKLGPNLQRYKSLVEGKFKRVKLSRNRRDLKFIKNIGFFFTRFAFFYSFLKIYSFFQLLVKINEYHKRVLFQENE